MTSTLNLQPSALSPAVADLGLVRSMRAPAILTLLGFASSVLAGQFHSYSASGKIDQKHYEFTVSQADIARTPVWAPDADFPPLSARKAQDIARREMQELLCSGKQPWGGRENTIAEM